MMHCRSNPPIQHHDVTGKYERKLDVPWKVCHLITSQDGSICMHSAVVAHCVIILFVFHSECFAHKFRNKILIYMCSTYIVCYTPLLTAHLITKQFRLSPPPSPLSSSLMCSVENRILPLRHNSLKSTTNQSEIM